MMTEHRERLIAACREFAANPTSETAEAELLLAFLDWPFDEQPLVKLPARLRTPTIREVLEIVP